MQRAVGPGEHGTHLRRLHRLHRLPQRHRPHIHLVSKPGVQPRLAPGLPTAAAAAPLPASIGRCRRRRHVVSAASKHKAVASIVLPIQV